VSAHKNNWFYIAVSLLAALAVFAAALLVLRWSVVIAALLSLGCYGGLCFLLTPALRLGGVDIEHMKNSEEIMTLVEEGEKDLASIKTISGASKDPRIKAKALSVYREGEKIIEYVKKNPAKAVMARRFFNFYLDKANDLLKKYDNLISAEIETNRLGALKEKTLSALDAILRGMALQFSRLISSEVIDIEADIKLLENAVRMEDS
jgi:hypothetical protein